ncbi:MAG: hypothetical protein ACRD4B_09160, partial [Acidobacteriota bacterium]
MKKEFPFGWAFVFALVVHALVGIFLKENPLLIAAPVPLSSANGPVKMHFVESPPQAKSVPANPDAEYLSDAARKAGPLVKTEKREQKTTEYAQKSPGPQQQSPPVAKSGRSTSGRQPEREAGSLPQIERPALEQTPGPGDYRIPPSGLDEKKLADSLQNLDQFIAKGEGPGTEGSGTGDG